MGVTRLVCYATALALSAPASAADNRISITTGNDLVASCADSSPSYVQTYCWGFIGGVIDGVQAQRVLAKADQIFCLRPGVTNAQIKAIVAAFLDRDPTVRDQNAAAIVIIAMMAAFPCPKK